MSEEKGQQNGKIEENPASPWGTVQYIEGELKEAKLWRLEPVITALGSIESLEMAAIPEYAIAPDCIAAPTLVREDLTSIGFLSDLKRVALQRTNFPKDSMPSHWMRSFLGLSNLDFLRMDHIEMDEACRHCLMQCTSLTSLSLSNVGCLDTGSYIGQGLDSLITLTSLKKLQLLDVNWHENFVLADYAVQLNKLWPALVNLTSLQLKVYTKGNPKALKGDGDGKDAEEAAAGETLGDGLAPQGKDGQVISVLKELKPGQLEHLTLDLNRLDVEHELESISKQTSLQSLDIRLGGSLAISLSGLSNLAGLDSLALGGLVNIGESDFLAKLGKLTKLQCSINKKDIDHLKSMKSLVDLSLWDQVDMEPSDWSKLLPAWSSIAKLDISKVPHFPVKEVLANTLKDNPIKELFLTQEQLAELACSLSSPISTKLEHIKSTALSHKPMDDVDLTNLFKSTPKLKYCQLGDGQCSASLKQAIIAAMGELSDIIEIRLPKVLAENKEKITDSDLAPLTKLTGLEVLDLRAYDCSEVSEDGIKNLNGLDKLKEVLLSGGLGKSSFKDLAEFKSLVKVAFYDADATEMEWASLKDCTQLKILHFVRSNVSDVSLTLSLGTLDKLEAIGCYACDHITDLGVINALQDKEFLRYVEIKSCKKIRGSWVENMPDSVVAVQPIDRSLGDITFALSGKLP
eukprot:TRINITY_DN285_c0_g2_i1.p1 TRINITY_DN285_c0_g2~~TRINITY_DN285_c0_g2_i1.p1  ORF type:complete len:687 (-),score=87.69 TRINITY_DN285_c0_g2_i1:423-2483(-)